MGIVKVELTHPGGGLADFGRIDATTEEEITRQKEKDDAEAVQDMALHIRNIRKRLLLTQEEFSRRINVPLATLRNWEQGKRRPTGAARALLKILSCSPETMRFLEQ